MKTMDICISILRKVGEVEMKANQAEELIRALGGKLDGNRRIYLGDLSTKEDGLYRTLFA